MRTQEFFHGTTHDVEPLPGTNVERIVPFVHAKKIHAEQGDEWAGHEKYPELYKAEPWRAEHVFSTSNEPDAWGWASGYGRARVYKVEPEGLPEHGSYTTEDAQGETISRHARVLGVQFTPPASVASQWKSPNWLHLGHGAVQGTLTGEDYRGATVGHDWAPYYSSAAHLASERERKRDEQFDRAAKSVRRQQMLNNRGRQGRLF